VESPRCHRDSPLGENPEEEAGGGGGRRRREEEEEEGRKEGRGSCLIISSG